MPAEPAIQATAIAGIKLVDDHCIVVDDLALLVGAVAAGQVPLAALQPAQAWLDDQARASDGPRDSCTSPRSLRIIRPGKAMPPGRIISTFFCVR